LTEFEKKKLSFMKGKSGLCEMQWLNLTREYLKLVSDLKIQMKLGSFGWPMGIVVALMLGKDIQYKLQQI